MDKAAECIGHAITRSRLTFALMHDCSGRPEGTHSPFSIWIKDFPGCRFTHPSRSYQTSFRLFKKRAFESQDALHPPPRLCSDCLRNGFLILKCLDTIRCHAMHSTPLSAHDGVCPSQCFCRTPSLVRSLDVSAAGAPLPNPQTGPASTTDGGDSKSVVKLRLHTELNLCSCDASVAKPAARSAPVSADCHTASPAAQQHSLSL